MGTPDIKVITGVRRSGKSKLLEAFRDYVSANVEDVKIIHINFSLDEFEELLEHSVLHAYITERYDASAVNLVLIDEVQMCEGFERAINSLHASEKYDIYVTGSNAFLLSSDLATLFTGRTFSIEVFPFSLSEFRRYYSIADIDEAFRRYAEEGGMSGAYVYSRQEHKFQYIKEVFDTLILRDIKAKYKIRNTTALERTVDFMMDNIGNITAGSNIADALGRASVKTSNKTIDNYIEYLKRAFAFYEVKRYDLKGKKYLSSGKKYYLSDHSFRAARLGHRNPDYGRIYENIVGIELLRRGYELYVGVLYKTEIDFVAVRRSEKIYIQVSDDISAGATFEREYKPLLKIKDAYPKLIIANTRREMYTYEGIEVYDIARWLEGGRT